MIFVVFILLQIDTYSFNFNYLVYVITNTMQYDKLCKEM